MISFPAISALTFPLLRQKMIENPLSLSFPFRKRILPKHGKTHSRTPRPSKKAKHKNGSFGPFFHFPAYFIVFSSQSRAKCQNRRFLARLKSRALLFLTGMPLFRRFSPSYYELISAVIFYYLPLSDNALISSFIVLSYIIISHFVFSCLLFSCHIL